MLESIKKWQYATILSIGLLSIVSCTGESTAQEYIRESISLDTFANDNNGLYIYYSKGASGDNHKMAVLENNATKWVHKPLDTSMLDTSTITYTDTKVIVKEKNIVVFEDTLPSVSQIEESLGFNLDDYAIKYTPFRVGKNFSWDRKTHIISVGLDKYSKDCHAVEPCFKSMYYLSAINDNNHWNINLVYKLESQNSISTGDMLQIKNNVLYSKYTANDGGGYTVDRLSTDSNRSFCFTEYNENFEKRIGYCLVNTDNGIIKIRNNYTIKVEKLLDFWHGKNRHVFYDPGGLDRGKYILYKMYTKDDLANPINKQKIYWEDK